MKKKCFIALITFVIISSCQQTKRQSSGTRTIDDLDIKQTIDLALNIALINFKDADYSIYPFFHAGITDSTFHKSFAEKNTGIKSLSQQTLNLISQYREKEGAALSRYIIDEDKTNRISESYTDLILTISPPMIDETQQMVYFFIEALFPYNNSIGASEIFYAIKLYRENENGVETVSGVLEASFNVID